MFGFKDWPPHRGAAAGEASDVVGDVEAQAATRWRGDRRESRRWKHIRPPMPLEEAVKMPLATQTSTIDLVEGIPGATAPGVVHGGVRPTGSSRRVLMRGGRSARGSSWPEPRERAESERNFDYAPLARHEPRMGRQRRISFAPGATVVSPPWLPSVCVPFHVLSQGTSFGLFRTRSTGLARLWSWSKPRLPSCPAYCSAPAPGDRRLAGVDVRRRRALAARAEGRPEQGRPDAVDVPLPRRR